MKRKRRRWALYEPSPSPSSTHSSSWLQIQSYQLLHSPPVMLPRHRKLCSQTVCTNKFISSVVFPIFFHTSEKSNQQWQVKIKYSTVSLRETHIEGLSAVMSLSADFCHALRWVYIWGDHCDCGLWRQSFWFKTIHVPCYWYLPSVVE